MQELRRQKKSKFLAAKVRAARNGNYFRAVG